MLASSQGTLRFTGSLRFTFQTLQACAVAAETQATLAHSVKISTSGKPIFIIAEEQSIIF
jgi:hypothetical protein